MNYPGYNKQIIGDYNTEGYDSVDSEDFEPGFGCVVPRIQPIIALPEMKDNRTEDEKKMAADRLKYFFMTDAENEKRQDEFLKSKGL